MQYFHIGVLVLVLDLNKTTTVHYAESEQKNMAGCDKLMDFVKCAQLNPQQWP